MTRWRCDTRRVVLRRDLIEWIDLESPVIDSSGQDPIVTGWRVERPSLRGAITPLRSDLNATEPTQTVDRYRITLTEPVEVSANERFRTHAGRVFAMSSGLALPTGGLVWEFEVTLELE